METFLLVSVILLWIVFLLNLLLTLALVRRVNAPPAPFPGMGNGLPTGTPAPDFSAQTLEGKTVTLADYTGHPTTFVFVAPHCRPCHEILPTLKTLAPQAHAVGSQLVLVSDGNRQETEKMMRTLEGQVEVLVTPQDEHPFFADYHTTITPSYCSLDEQGKIVMTGHPDHTDSDWQRLQANWSQQTAVAKRK